MGGRLWVLVYHRKIECLSRKFLYSSLWPSHHLLISVGSQHFRVFLQHWHLGFPSPRPTNAHICGPAQCEWESSPQPWHCPALCSAPIFRQDLRQSVVEGLTFPSHSPVGGEYQWEECCVLYFKHSPAVFVASSRLHSSRGSAPPSVSHTSWLWG